MKSDETSNPSAGFIPPDRPTARNLFSSSGSLAPPAPPSSIELGDDDLFDFEEPLPASKPVIIKTPAVRLRVWASD